MALFYLTHLKTITFSYELIRRDYIYMNFVDLKAIYNLKVATFSFEADHPLCYTRSDENT